MESDCPGTFPFVEVPGVASGFTSEEDSSESFEDPSKPFWESSSGVGIVRGVTGSQGRLRSRYIHQVGQIIISNGPAVERSCQRAVCSLIIVVIDGPQEMTMAVCGER